MIRLDGDDDLWVLIFAAIGSRDEATRRRNLTRTHVGRFDGRHFTTIHQHELDFGTDCYAVQVWRGSDGPRAIAWAANWTDVSADRDFASAMTLPRRLLWQDGRLLTPPIAAVDTLRVGEPVRIGPGDGVSLLDGFAEITLAVAPDTPFTLEIEHPDRPVSVTYDGRTLELLHEPSAPQPGPRCLAICPALGRVRLIVDVGAIELYADDGAACCTKRIDSPLPFAAVRLSPEAHGVSGEIWPLRLPGVGSAS